MDELTRRKFLKAAGIAGAGALLLGPAGCKSGFTRIAETEAGVKPRVQRASLDGVCAATGEDAGAIVEAAIEEAGGMSKFVRKGDFVVIKPNIGFDRRPEQAATTNPEVVAALARLCFKAGAGRVKVFDNPCNIATRTFRHSGIAKAAEAAGAIVEIPRSEMFAEVAIPNAKVLKSWMLHRDVIKADVFINVPIVKHHGETGVTLGMKNLMGCAGGQRGAWHVQKLSQRIADINTMLRPDLVVIDGFRVLKDHGPTGGSLSDVFPAHTVAVATDIVAADAYGARLFGKSPADVEYIAIAHAMGLGEMDLDKVKIREVKV